MKKIQFQMAGSSGKSFDPEEYELLRVQWYNESTGNLTGYDCPKCKNRGAIAFKPAEGGICYRECECVRTRASVEKMERSGLQNVIKKYTFERFQAKEDWQKQLKDGAMAYAAAPSGWLLMCGQSGSGKTHLCTAICRKLLLDGMQVQYMPWRETIRQIKQADFDGKEALLTQLKTAQVLYIDDLFKTGKSPDGSCSPTAADISLAFEILNHRYIGGRLTLISTEWSPEALIRLEEATAGRIMEMVADHTYYVEDNANRNYRLQRIHSL